jgi:hypothetical protein
MKTFHPNPVRLAGFSALLAGICYVLVGLLHPANVPSSVTTPGWVLVHVLACAMAVFGLLGLPGLYARQAGRIGWLGLVGALLLGLWFALILGFSFVEAFILPQVAAASPAFVSAWMGMLVGPAGTFDLGLLPTVWIATLPLYLLGGLLFGIATFRARILPRVAGVLLAVSTLLAPAAALLPNAAQPKTAIPMGIALAWLGYSLWAERRTALVAPPTREPVTAA